MDYSFFDGLIDAVFVISEDRGIVYCNESAAKMCESSVRRLAKGKPIYDTIEFSDKTLFTMPGGEQGRDNPAPYTEIQFSLKSGKTGKVQVAIQPFTEPEGTKRWAVMLRDVTLEEVLHAKHHKQLEQLENYSKNLERMVEERTLQVKHANEMLNAIMNSLGQGFFVFNAEGTCAEIYTKACEDILETVPAQKKIWDVLKVPQVERSTFDLWLKALFGEQLSFETIKELGPTLFKHSHERHVTLDYFPLRNDAGKIANVVVVATDKTSEFLANRALEKEKKYARMVVKLVTSKKQFAQFLDNAEKGLAELKIHAKNPKAFDHEYAFRVLHTLEGEAATYSATEIWSASREAQEVIEPLKRGETVDVPRTCAHFYESLVQAEIQYRQFLKDNAALFEMVGFGSGDKIEVRVPEIEEILRRMAQKGVSASICNEVADALLREPLENAFRHFQDVVASVAEKLNKKLKPLEFQGFDLRVHHPHYQDLFATFVHAYRNAVDHGIEAPGEREMMGKPPEGRLVTSVERFQHQGKDWLRIQVADDGGGISVDRIREKMKSYASVDEIARLDDKAVLQQVFHSGLSTKEEVGEFSGRGIGMNAIKAEAEKLGGRAWVESTLGQGTRLTVEVPDLPRLAHQLAAA